MGADLPELRLRRQAMGKEASFSATDSSDGLTSTDDEDAFASWQQFEIKLLLWIQSCRPWLTPPALFVHHLVSLEVVSPVLAGMVWLTSLPEAASTIACICVSQAVNTTIKWCFQRPRPLWFLPLSSGVVNMEGTWQGDYSFPSSHGQFFAGFVFCAAGVYQILLRWYPALVFLVVLSGLTRNYLGLHWCSDTLVGGCLGSLIGLVWGAHDPIPWLMNTSDGVLSAIIATFVIVCLVSMLQLARGLVPSVRGMASQCCCFFTRRPTRKGRTGAGRLCHQATRLRVHRSRVDDSVVRDAGQQLLAAALAEQRTSTLSHR
eukprot:TRINITY_DN57963_c0_g1_i1.p1 TRINITY_DN57963_c0_g1~~TRINITY_DN57963_c0_g1_i1.p1  ORF type:complete len:318 (-),score=20.15 TRINITY_DN57963_c0_g1_i1:252-1205(-)